MVSIDYLCGNDREEKSHNGFHQTIARMHLHDGHCYETTQSGSLQC